MRSSERAKHTNASPKYAIRRYCPSKCAHEAGDQKGWVEGKEDAARSRVCEPTQVWIDVNHGYGYSKEALGVHLAPETQLLMPDLNARDDRASTLQVILLVRKMTFFAAERVKSLTNQQHENFPRQVLRGCPGPISADPGIPGVPV